MPTLANVLSSRFPEARRLISRHLNLHDRGTLLLLSRDYYVSVTSVDHLAPFKQYFPGGCDVLLPLPSNKRHSDAIKERCAYGADFRDDQFHPCSRDTSLSVIRPCEGPKLLKNSRCERAVCRFCAKRAYEMTDLGNYQNRALNFGVTPICDSYADKVPGTPADVVDCGCTGPPPVVVEKKGDEPLVLLEKKDDELWLCLECRIAHNLERMKAADDMARAYLYMKESKNGTPEYLPGMQIGRNKLPVCPCGNARYWTKCNFKRVRGMCVWCGTVKMPSLEGILLSMLTSGLYDSKHPHWNRPYLNHPLAQMCSPMSEYIVRQQTRTDSTQHRVISPEKLTALQTQISEKGVPRSLSKGENKYWSYNSITDEARVLDPNLRRDYEGKRREKASNRQKLVWDDREGFLMNFRWPFGEDRRGDRKALEREILRRHDEIKAVSFKDNSEKRTDYI